MEQLKLIMKEFEIGILCMQETHFGDSISFDSDRFLCVLSSNVQDDREYAGVGFLIAPWVRQSVKSYLQYSSRMAALRVKIVRGILTIISAYAPHNGYDVDEKSDFFQKS